MYTHVHPSCVWHVQVRYYDVAAPPPEGLANSTAGASAVVAVVRPEYEACISPASDLHLGCISAVSRQVRPEYEAESHDRQNLTVGETRARTCTPCMYTRVHPLMCMARAWRVYGMCRRVRAHLQVAGEHAPHACVWHVHPHVYGMCERIFKSPVCMACSNMHPMHVCTCVHLQVAGAARVHARTHAPRARMRMCILSRVWRVHRMCAQVPLVYTRHTSRFLTAFLLFLPFAMWPAMDK